MGTELNQDNPWRMRISPMRNVRPNVDGPFRIDATLLCDKKHKGKANSAPKTREFDKKPSLFRTRWGAEGPLRVDETLRSHLTKLRGEMAHPM